MKNSLLKISFIALFATIITTSCNPGNAYGQIGSPLAAYTFALPVTLNTYGPAYLNDGYGNPKTNGTGNFLPGNTNTGNGVISIQIWNGTSFETVDAVIANTLATKMSLAIVSTELSNSISNWVTNRDANSLKAYQNNDTYILTVAYTPNYLMASKSLDPITGKLSAAPGQGIMYQVTGYQQKKVSEVVTW